MTRITKKAFRGNDTALPILRQENPIRGEFDLWERHLRKTYGLHSGFASAYASIREMEGLCNER